MGVGPGSLTPGVQSVYWVGSVEVEDDGEALVVEEDHHEEKVQEHRNIPVRGLQDEHSWRGQRTKVLARK